MEAVALIPHIWILPVVTAVFVVITLLCIFLWKNAGGTFFAGAISVIFVITFVVALIPFNGKYHHFYELSGTVLEVTNTISEGSGELTSTPVITLSGYDDPILSDTVRVNSLVGEDVTLICTYSWVPYGLDVTKCDLLSISR